MTRRDDRREIEEGVDQHESGRSSFPREPASQRSARTDEVDRYRSATIDRPAPKPSRAFDPKKRNGAQRKPVMAMATRLARAIKTDRALPNRERAMLRARVHQFPVGYDRMDYPPEAKTRFQPSKQDLADYLPVMAHYAALPADLQAVIAWVALGDSMTTAAWRYGRHFKETISHDECRARYWIAVAQCAERDACDSRSGDPAADPAAR